ncbi:MAG: hypothetical protein ACLFM0_07440 [Spirochaetales bacterium]
MKTIEEIPRPHIRFFPDHADRKRVVEVRISLYRGYGHHVYADVIEEPNPLWDHETGRWIVPEGDSHGAGIHRVMGFATERHARRWIESIFASEFSPDTHELTYRDEVTERWLYPEGD